MCNKKTLLILFVLLCLLFAGCNALTPIDTPAETPAPQTAAPVPTETPELPVPEKVVLTAPDGTEYELDKETDAFEIADVGIIPQLIEHRAKLPAIRKIRFADGLDFTYDDVAAVKNAFPDAAVDYTVTVCGSEISADTVEVSLPGLDAAALDEAAGELRKLPALERVDLNENSGAPSPEPGAVFYQSLTLDDVNALEQALPGVVFDYKFSLYGKVVSTADERIEFVDTEIGDEGIETFREILPSMTNLQYLKLDDCGVSSEVMAQLRDDFPDVKIVWRVYFSACGEGPVGFVTYNCLTDTERIWATGCVTDMYAKQLQYCTDVKYLDLGHNCITNIDFVRYMPKLEVAVLSITWVESVEPLTECPNLEYLEIFSSRVTDITPLEKCTNLKHLNISNLSAVRDISCLYGLDLDRLYVTMSSIPQEQQEKFMSLHPDCECEFRNVDPSKGHWRFVDGNWENNVPENRVERYALLYEQIGYADYANLSA